MVDDDISAIRRQLTTRGGLILTGFYLAIGVFICTGIIALGVMVFRIVTA